MKISIICKKDYDSRQAPIHMGIKEYQGRQYAVKGIVKEYSVANRIKKLALFVFPTIFSMGTLLFNKKCNRKWQKILYGKFTQPKFMVAQDILTIRTQPLALGKKQLSVAISKREEIQQILDNNHIQLNCVKPEVLIHRNKVEKKVIANYLKHIPANHPQALLLNNINVITFEELMNGLKSCCIQLNHFLQNHPYSIGFAFNKSQQWVAELALPYLNHTPISKFSVSIDSIKDHSYQSRLDKNVSHFVVFDDASYSGNQLHNKIRAFKEQIAECCPNKPCELYLVVPFLSSTAKKRLLNLVNEEKPRLFSEKENKGSFANLNVTVITTDRKIKTFKDIFTSEQVKQINQILTPGTGQPQSISITEWKIPDNLSVDMKVKQAYIKTNNQLEWIYFTTNFNPPYS